ncbi:MAG: hypothetical protein CM15mV142_360 [Caudoviricetes sp.]|nr:MAG: hypothetical protein CM15mV142_360 [Caudoviricetes sp.]
MGQIYLNNRDSNNSSHRGNIVAYAPPSGGTAQSNRNRSNESVANDNGGLMVAEKEVLLVSFLPLWVVGIMELL